MDKTKPEQSGRDRCILGISGRGVSKARLLDECDVRHHRLEPFSGWNANRPTDGPTSPHIIVTRNLEPIYDNATALHAFSTIRRVFPTAKLTLAGSGPQREALKR